MHLVNHNPSNLQPPTQLFEVVAKHCPTDLGKVFRINASPSKLSERRASLAFKKMMTDLRCIESHATETLEQRIPTIVAAKTDRKSVSLIREAMLAQLGALELNKNGGSVVYFLELDDDTKTIYLCQCTYDKHAPLDSWTSARCASFSYHAVQRSLQYKLWGEHITDQLSDITRSLLFVYLAYARHQLTYKLKALRLFSNNWCLSLSGAGVCFLVRRTDDGLPHVSTMYRSRSVVGHRHNAGSRSMPLDHEVNMQMLGPKHLARQPLLKLSTTLGMLGVPLGASERPYTNKTDANTVENTVENKVEANANLAGFFTKLGSRENMNQLSA